MSERYKEVYGKLVGNRENEFGRSKIHPFTPMVPKKRKDGSYPYISASINGVQTIENAINVFTKDKGRAPKTFLDVGSGKGGMLLAALLFDLQPTGVEYSRELVAASREVYAQFPDLNTKKIRTVVTDFFKWKPKKTYDIVYFFNPWTDGRIWAKFLNRIKELCPPDQIFASFYNMPTTGFRWIERGVYRNTANPVKVASFGCPI